MTLLRHFFGWNLVVFADTLANVAHHLCHAGAWCMDINIEEECVQCRAHEENNNDPTDGPWAV